MNMTGERPTVFINNRDGDLDRKPVSSTIVTSIGYDSESAILEVEFAGGSVYRYFDVPEHMYRELTAGASVGKTMTSAIIGKFPYAKV